MHTTVIQTRASPCLESICSQSPCVRSLAGHILDTAGHVGLVGKSAIRGDPRQRRVGGPDSLPGMARPGARPEGGRGDIKYPRETSRQGPRSDLSHFAPMRQTQRWISHQGSRQFIRPIATFRFLHPGQRKKQQRRLRFIPLRDSNNSVRIVDSSPTRLKSMPGRQREIENGGPGRGKAIQMHFECLVQHDIASLHAEAAKVARFLITTRENERCVSMFVKVAAESRSTDCLPNAHGGNVVRFKYARAPIGIVIPRQREAWILGGAAPSALRYEKGPGKIVTRGVG